MCHERNGKTVFYINFVIVSSLNFFSLGVTAEALQANIDRKSAFSQNDPKFQVDGLAHTTHSSCQKTRINDLSRCIRIWAQLSFCHKSRVKQTDRQLSRG